ncbi:MAG TPA: hypothetical protein VGM18_07145 [Candidatus Sulfotelmatobacter sp.]|jgi:hypothetical protein
MRLRSTLLAQWEIAQTFETNQECNMKRSFGLLLTSLFLSVPMLMAQDHSDHVEVGAFVDYFRINDASQNQNFVGVGGRGAFAVNSSVQIEAEMAYDFKRNYTSTFTNGVTTQFVNTSFRTLHGFFGPKFQTGSGPFRVFLTGKVGFDNFSVNNQNAPTGFVNTVGLTNGSTFFAVYPGGGLEAFAGPFGVRAEVGDDIYFNNGAHNNLRVSLGPQFRF